MPLTWKPTPTINWLYSACWQACYQRVQPFAQNMIGGILSVYLQRFQDPFRPGAQLAVMRCILSELDHSRNTTTVPFCRFSNIGTMQMVTAVNAVREFPP